MHNVSLAIERVKPYAVDVSSCVETEGVKDFDKMKELKRVREYGKISSRFGNFEGSMCLRL